jgi:hypothetical protein
LPAYVVVPCEVVEEALARQEPAPGAQRIWWVWEGWGRRWGWVRRGGSAAEQGPGSGAAQAGLTLEVQAAPPPGQAFTETLKRQTSASTTQEVSSSAAAVAARARAAIVPSVC